ncbi:MAG: NAD(P)H-hydrate dehydratase, partial [Alphaproteobacteria bacterium]
PKTGDNKYSHGHAVIFGGAKMTGAAKLAAHATMRSGAGLATILCPPESFEIYAEYKAHLLVEPLSTTEEKNAFLQDPHKSAVLIGPGLGVTDETRAIVLATLAQKDKALCLDADALSVFQDDPATLFAAPHENCVLTPHDGEFARLFGTTDGDKITRTRQAAAKAGAVVLLKGADTVIAAPDGRAVINTNAPAFLATAGAGDVLAGIITGLLAQHMPAFEAAAAGAWLHGAAAQKCGRGLVAEDIAEYLPAILKELDNNAASR